MIIGILGILKAGAAYVPIEGDCPRERLGWMIEELGIGVVVTQSRAPAMASPGTGYRQSAWILTGMK